MAIDELVKLLKQHSVGFMPPLIDIVVAEFGHSPFLILIACLLSLRAKDTTTVHVCRALFRKITIPEQLLAMDRAELEIIIFKTGFYKNKAQILQEVCAAILRDFNGVVPGTYDELISIKGVGPKTANLVMAAGFGVPAICVDTHVHRISNRLGLVQTKTVEESQVALQKVLPKKYWSTWNNLLVMWGQNICAPISPRCSGCAIAPMCKRIGVSKSR